MSTSAPNSQVPLQTTLVEYPLITQQPPPYTGPAHAITLVLRSTRTLDSLLSNDSLLRSSPISRIPLYDRTLFSDSIQVCIACCPNHAFENSLPYDTSTAVPRPTIDHRPTILAEVESLSPLSPVVSSDSAFNYAVVFPQNDTNNMIFALVRAVCPCCPEHSHILGLCHRNHPRFGAFMTTEPSDQYVEPTTQQYSIAPSVFYPPPPNVTTPMAPSFPYSSMPMHHAPMHAQTPPPAAHRLSPDAPDLQPTPVAPEPRKPSPPAPKCPSPEVPLPSAKTDSRPSTSHDTSSGLFSQLSSIAPSDSLSTAATKPAHPSTGLPYATVTSTKAPPLSKPEQTEPTTFPLPKPHKQNFPTPHTSPVKSAKSEKTRPPRPTFEDSYEIHSLALLICRYFSLARSNHGKIYSLIKTAIFDKPVNAAIELSLCGITAEFSSLRTHLHDFHAAQFASPTPPSTKHECTCPIKGCIFFPREFGRSDLTIIQSGFKSKKSSDYISSLMRMIKITDSSLIPITVNPTYVDMQDPGIDFSLFLTSVSNP